MAIKRLTPEEGTTKRKAYNALKAALGGAHTSIVLTRYPHTYFAVKRKAS